jgi:hypothetical protein
VAAVAESDARERLRLTWRGVWLLEGALVTAVFFVFVAISSELDDCSFIAGCTPEENETGAAAVALLVIALVAMLGGLVVAAFASGWPRWRALGQGSVAAGVFGLALVIAWQYVDELDSYVTPLVIATALAGVIAIRPAGGTAVALRVGVAVLVVATAVVAHESLASLFLPFLVPPAIGMADALALRLGADLES